MDNQGWKTDGLCRQVDPELWFPEKGGNSKPAKTICAACPVLALCRDYALTNRVPFGIWGGMSERDRKRHHAAALRPAAPAAAA